MYIHFLRLIAYAIDERYQRAVAECVAPFNCDKKPFKHAGIKSIKGFTRMFNKLVSPVDHRYAGKPRPGVLYVTPVTSFYVSRDDVNYRFTLSFVCACVCMCVCVCVCVCVYLCSKERGHQPLSRSHRGLARDAWNHDGSPQTVRFLR